MRSDDRDARGCGLALIGAGYWGARLARNLVGAAGGTLRVVCDTDATRAVAVAELHGARATTSLVDVLDDERVDAVIVATPAATHRELVTACIDADRDVLVEKPLAGSVVEARAVAAAATTRGRIVMCDHTYRFSPVVDALHEQLANGAVGALASITSVRTNLDHGQPDVDVFWDLAHHDLSILGFVLPLAHRPVAVSARLDDPTGPGRAHAGTLLVHLAGDARAEVRVDWRAPRKQRTMTFTGDAGELLWDDLAPADRRLEWRGAGTARHLRQVGTQEPLRGVVTEFLRAITARDTPSCGVREELAVLAALEAATLSAAGGGRVVALDPFPSSQLEPSP
jgi:predicted dehydrogenase